RRYRARTGTRCATSTRLPRTSPGPVRELGRPARGLTIHRVRQQPGSEAGAFWDAYGPPPAGPTSEVRELFYRARNVLGARLDIHRRGLDLAGIPAVHWDLGEVLA